MVSVFITSYNEEIYLKKLLHDIDRQKFGSFEILLLEAGRDQEDQARKSLKARASSLEYFHQPGATRTYSLNQLIGKATGDILIRLDARTHIDDDYIGKIVELLETSGAVNVGGIMWPIGESGDQQVIAELMKSPWVFGGGKFRTAGFRGEAETVYLGAFKKQDITFSEWYDSKHPQISEDSDLNYRLRKMGKKVFIDSSIVAYHYPRESLTKFFRLCFHYGLGRGLFILKHKTLLAPRQFLFVTGALGFAVLCAASLLLPFCKKLVLLLIVIYGGVAFILSFKQQGSFIHKKKFFLGIMGAHLCWLGGLLYSPIQYCKDLQLSSPSNNL